VLRSLIANSRLIAVGTMLVTMTTVSFYMITAYTPTFGNSVLHLASVDSLIVTLCVGASNLFWLPVMGVLSDRVGRRPLLFACTILMLVTAYPAMLWLVRDPSFSRLLTVELWLSFLYGSYNGAMMVFLTEIMPVDVRTTGFALAYSGRRRLWWLYARDQHLSDSRHGESRGSGLVAVLRHDIQSSSRTGSPAPQGSSS
jgi:MFS family permease